MCIKDIIRRFRIFLLHLWASSLTKLPISGNVLIVAPHPDDEVIGCGGLIRRLVEKGQRVDVCILSGGGKSHNGCCDIDEHTLIEARRNLSRKAAEIISLPIDHLHFLNYPDGSISYDNENTPQLQKMITELKPDAIFVPHKGEGWSDHIETGKIVREMLKDGGTFHLYEYCVWFWYYNVWNIDWKQAYVLRMTKEEQDIKNKAMNSYILPKAPCGKPLSGVLPKVFVDANRWDKELYFRVK